jgi:hypothetical protein
LEENMRQAYIVTFLAVTLIGVVTASPDPTHNRGRDLDSRRLNAQINDFEGSNESVLAGSVILVNNAWNRVTVEVRKGKYDDVNQNSGYDTRTIGKGKWAIPCSSEEGYVWWRRDADPDHPNGQWTGWTRKACFGRNEEVSL